MRWKNDKIGFDDRLVMVIGILVLALLIPPLFFGSDFSYFSFLTPAHLAICIAITAGIWIGNRYIMIWARRRYPLFADVRRRLWVQSAVMLAFTVAFNNLLCPLLQPNHFHAANMPFRTNAASLFCTLLVVAIYENIYFVGELRKSVEEKELLKRENLNAQLSALKTQVNPHFLFNNLNTLAAIIPEDPGQAIDFVQQLSKVYRHILEVRDEKSICLREELDVLKAYAFLLKTRFGDNLDISIRVTDEKLQQKVVPLSLQILMENAIKHNIVSSAKPLHIHISTEEGKLIICNNLQRKNQLAESTGMGLDNIRNRYKLLGEQRVEVKEGPSSFTVSIPLVES